MREKFECRCAAEESEPEQQILSVLGDAETEYEDFWELAKTNLQAGRIRLLFVADRIPGELRRIIEFLNQQMDPAEVLAVEISSMSARSSARSSRASTDKRLRPSGGSGVRGAVGGGGMPSRLQRTGKGTFQRVLPIATFLAENERLIQRRAAAL